MRKVKDRKPIKRFVHSRILSRQYEIIRAHAKTIQERKSEVFLQDVINEVIDAGIERVIPRSESVA